MDPGEPPGPQGLGARQEVRQSATRGRCVVSTTDLCPGDVVCCEEAVCISVLANRALTVCDMCLGFNTSNIDEPLPVICPHCEHVAYCSPACAERAGSQWHAAECAALAALRTA
eukprot:EG_transcript_51128